MSIRQDSKTKTWFYRFTRNGRSYFRSGFRTAALAREAEAALYNEPERKGTSLIFKDAVEWYLNTVSLNKKTAYIDRARLGLAAKFFDNQKIVSIQPEQIEDFIGRLSELRAIETPRLKKLSDQTRNHYLAVLRALFNQLIKRGRFNGPNPGLLVSFKKVAKARVRFLYPAEEKLLSPIVNQNAVLWPYYLLALSTGMRIRELMNIQVKDLDLIMGHLFIPNSKNSKSRYVPLSPNVATFVSDVMKGKGQEDRLLPNWSYTYLRKQFRDACSMAKLSNLRIHDMRHTFAQHLLAKGESIYLVSKLMGHSSVAVTQEHYGHLAVSDLSNTVSKIDGVVSMQNVLQCSCNETCNQGTSLVQSR